MRICDLSQEQNERSNKISSNELDKHEQCYR